MDASIITTPPREPAAEMMMSGMMLGTTCLTDFQSTPPPSRSGYRSNQNP